MSFFRQKYLPVEGSEKERGGTGISFFSFQSLEGFSAWVFQAEIPSCGGVLKRKEAELESASFLFRAWKVFLLGLFQAEIPSCGGALKRKEAELE